MGEIIAHLQVSLLEGFDFFISNMKALIVVLPLQEEIHGLLYCFNVTRVRSRSSYYDKILVVNTIKREFITGALVTGKSRD